jgi:hypothetical protein
MARSGAARAPPEPNLLSEPVMALRLKFASLICGLALGLTAATHFIGWAYRVFPGVQN